jgi:hypothetical protein
VGIRSREVFAVMEMAVERYVIPFADLIRVQVKYHGQRVELVEARCYVPVLDVSETADVNDELGTPALAGQLITGPLDVTVSQTQTFAGIAESCSWLDPGWGGWVQGAQAADRHRRNYLSVTNLEHARHLRASMSGGRARVWKYGLLEVSFGGA